MARSSARRGQTEPIAALVAVVAICLGLSLYVGVLDGALPDSRDRQVADHAVDTVERASSVAGVVRPSRLSTARSTAPDGYRCNVTLVVDDRRWTAGPAPPNRTQTASRRVSARIGPGRIRPGTLRVVVWS
ncbi:hypothetical protein VB773_17575 [Haloarculaceae archaeon H-GB2-1]|nr:hypothetical protein [Haloarculaceae archaeon H-GB1-1]MEA5387709.1 hypothetical protein [Haloarculaceae archaeon H-GB11]MEA5409201.1 hypothetical protein [Haloarculaceae archaeon H-GB2-1]